MDVSSWELPDGLPPVERTVVRLVVLDSAGQVLLFHAHDPTYPEIGQWWELPGRGIEPGEDYLAAAILELRDETGSRRAGPTSARRRGGGTRRSRTAASAGCSTKSS